MSLHAVQSRSNHKLNTNFKTISLEIEKNKSIEVKLINSFKLVESKKPTFLP